MLDVAFLVGGIAALYFGAEWLVRGASRVAGAMNVSTLVIGLTVVAFGTSMPEMVAGLVAAGAGSTDIVLGNVVGSNIANVVLILGLAALFTVIPARANILRREVPFMVVTTGVVYALCATGEIGRVAGATLFAMLILFTWLALRWARKERDREFEAELERMEAELGLHEKTTLGTEIARLLAGLVTITIGAHLLVTAAIDIARDFGISEFLISVTMVAVGTSLPELATSIVCVMRNEQDVLVGNIVGSNIFNLLGALGLAAIVRPIPVDASIIAFDLPVVLLFTVAMGVGLFWHRGLVRWEGVALLTGYVAYLSSLFV